MGNRVTRLQRESVGGVKLDGLKEGEFRDLTESEIASF